MELGRYDSKDNGNYNLNTDNLNDIDIMNLFINGYLKLFGINDLVVPLDIINIINKMYLDEDLHLLKVNYRIVVNAFHYCINLQKILENK